MEDLLAGAIGEADRVELDSPAGGAGRGRRKSPGRRGIGNRRPHVEEREDPLQRRHGGLHDGVEAAQVPDRLEEAGGVLEEGDQGSEGQEAAQDLAAAVPDRQRGRQRADELDNRRERRLVDHRSQIGVPVVLVDRLEFPPILRLAAEELHQEHS